MREGLEEADANRTCSQDADMHEVQDRDSLIEMLQERVRMQDLRFELMKHQCEVLKRTNLLLEEAYEKALGKHANAAGLLSNEQTDTSDDNILGSDNIDSPDGAALPCDPNNDTKADCPQLGDSMTQDSGGSNEQAKDCTVDEELGRFVQCLKDRDICPSFYMEGHCRDVSQCVYSQHKAMGKF